MRSLKLCGLLLALCGCAGPNVMQTRTLRIVDYAQKDGEVVGTVETVFPEDTLLCSVETPTGSHIAKRVCRFEQEASWFRQRTQDMFHQIRAHQLAKDEPGGQYR